MHLTVAYTDVAIKDLKCTYPSHFNQPVLLTIPMHKQRSKFKYEKLIIIYKSFL